MAMMKIRKKRMEKGKKNEEKEGHNSDVKYEEIGNNLEEE